MCTKSKQQNLHLQNLKSINVLSLVHRAENSKTRGQAVKIEMRQLIMSHLIRFCTVCVNSAIFFVFVSGALEAGYCNNVTCHAGWWILTGKVIN